MLMTISSVSFAKVRLGAEGGVYINKMKFDKKVFSSDNRAGFFIGPKLKATMPLGFGLDAALLYSNRSIVFESDIDEQTKTLNYITVPVNIRWQIGTDRFAPYIATGPQLDCYIDNSKLTTVDGWKATFEHNTLSWNLGLGLMFADHVQVGFSWNFPVTNSGRLRQEFDDVTGQMKESIKTKMKNKEWAIRVNYYF